MALRNVHFPTGHWPGGHFPGGHWPSELVEEVMSNFDTLIDGCKEHIIDMFSDEITFQPGVLDRTIDAIINYIADDNQSPGALRHKSPLINIKVLNSNTLGIAASEILENSAFYVSIPPRKGADARSFQIKRIVKQTAVWVTYEVK